MSKWEYYARVLVAAFILLIGARFYGWTVYVKGGDWWHFLGAVAVVWAFIFARLLWPQWDTR